MLGRILSLDDADVQTARSLAEEYTQLSPRDLIHLAIMLRHGLDTIITADRGSESVRNIRTISSEHFDSDIL